MSTFKVGFMVTENFKYMAKNEMCKPCMLLFIESCKKNLVKIK